MEEEIEREEGERKRERERERWRTGRWQSLSLHTVNKEINGRRHVTYPLPPPFT
jgi:hypothetical protein